MLNFEFYNPTRIVFGKDKVAELARLVPPEGVGLATSIIFGGVAAASVLGVAWRRVAALGVRESGF